MKSCALGSLTFAMLLALCPVPACKHFRGGGDSGTATRLIDCGSEAVQAGAVRYLGRTNAVLADGGRTDEQAKSSLLALVAEAGRDVIACLLRDQGPRFAASARDNPEDVTSARAAARARAFIDEQGYRYKDEPPNL